MIVLDTTTGSLQIVLAGAKNTNDCPFVANYLDEPVGSTSLKPAGSCNPGTTNGTTAVTIVPATGLAPGWRRRLLSFNLNNADLAAVTVSIQYVDGATTYTLYKCILQTLEQLQYEEGFGFTTVDVNGAQKSQAAATSSATSTAQAAGSQASSMASIALNGSSQASSIAAAIVPASINSVSSQASSMAALVPASVSSAASLALLVSSNASLGSSVGWSTTLSKTKSSFGF